MPQVIYFVMLAIILLVSIGLHEYAHALVSHKLGDPTPKMQNRLTPNPIRHLDPIGFLMIFLIHFGWGKPVQVNPHYYKKPLWGELLVALAGPATNLLLAVMAILIILIYAKIGGYQGTELLTVIDALFHNQLAWDIMIFFWWLFAIINVSLAVFNMIPLPPLDGFRLVKIARRKGAYFMQKYQMYISILFLLLILGPWKHTIGWGIFSIAQWIFNVVIEWLGQIIFY